MKILAFPEVALNLELAGLIWQPEIGDEVLSRQDEQRVSILVDPHGMSPRQLREVYLWLPTVEQMVYQFEARQVILEHAGLELSEKQLCYRTVIQSQIGPIEARAETLRTSVGLALRDLLLVGDSANRDDEGNGTIH